MDRFNLVGIFYIFVVPAVLVSGFVIYFIMFLPLMIFVVAIFAFVYAAFLSGRMEYGPKQIRRVRIPGIPDELEELLKTTTAGGELMNVYLISVFEENEPLSQTDLFNRVKERYETQLTLQTIRNYILTLENQGLISSPVTPREREYRLTNEGHWCRRAIKVCFPRTFFWFAVRYDLGFRRLPEFPHNQSNAHTEGK